MNDRVSQYAGALLLLLPLDIEIAVYKRLSFLARKNTTRLF